MKKFKKISAVIMAVAMLMMCFSAIANAYGLIDGETERAKVELVPYKVKDSSVSKEFMDLTIDDLEETTAEYLRENLKALHGEGSGDEKYDDTFFVCVKLKDMDHIQEAYKGLTSITYTYFYNPDYFVSRVPKRRGNVNIDYMLQLASAKYTERDGEKVYHILNRSTDPVGEGLLYNLDINDVIPGMVQGILNWESVLAPIPQAYVQSPYTASSAASNIGTEEGNSSEEIVTIIPMQINPNLPAGTKIPDGTKVAKYEYDPTQYSCRFGVDTPTDIIETDYNCFSEDDDSYIFKVFDYNDSKMNIYNYSGPGIEDAPTPAPTTPPVNDDDNGDNNRPVPAPSPTSQPKPTTTPSVVPTNAPSSDEPLIDSNYTAAYIKGFDGGMFKPNAHITRGELSAIIARIISNGEIESADTNAYEVSFSDVKASDWSYKYIGFLEDYNVINGYEDGTFKPNGTVTRSEICAVIARAQRLAGVSYAGEFTDVSDKDWAKDYIAAMSANGFIKGYDGGEFRPYGTLTRAETVTIINRLLAPSEVINPVSFNDIAGHWAESEIIFAASERILN